MSFTLAQEVVPWFANPGMVGGLLGAAGGILGGFYGTMVGVCGPRGIGRKFVYALHYLLLIVGIGFAIAGVTALAVGQPYAVWYSLLLPGVIVTLVIGFLTPVLRMTYAAAEHRKLAAEEFRRSSSPSA